MSNKIKKISKKVEQEKRSKRVYWQGTLLGSIFLTVGKLAKSTISPDELLDKCEEYFNETKAVDSQKTMAEHVEDVAKYLGVEIEDNTKPAFVFIFDKEGYYAPYISLMYEDLGLLPLTSTYDPPIKQHINEDNIEVVEIFGD